MATRSLSAQQIVEEFKRSGKFDKLRRDSIEAFLTSEANSVLMDKVDTIALEALNKMQFLAPGKIGTENILSNIMNNLERFPHIDRAMDDVSENFKEEEFITGIDEAIQQIFGPGASEDSKAERSSPPASSVVHSGALNVSTPPTDDAIQIEQVERTVEKGSPAGLMLPIAPDPTFAEDPPNPGHEDVRIALQSTHDGDHERPQTTIPLASPAQQESPVSSGLDVLEAALTTETISLAGGGSSPRSGLIDSLDDNRGYLK